MEEEREPEEQASEPAAPTIAFDPIAHDIVVDVAGLCSIPFDSDASACESLRAFRFDAGKAIHSPSAGSYAVAGGYEVLKTLSLVHFRPATQRKPELCLSFADYAMASPNAKGVFVCSLQLPLLKRKNCYENVIRYTATEDIIGFSPISEGSTPWSVHLKPALQKLGGVHAQFELFKHDDVLKYLEKPMAGRVKELQEAAKKVLSTHVEGLRRQDKNLAEKHSAQLGAQLQRTVDWLFSLETTNYDKPLVERIIKVGEDGAVEGGGPQWLTPSKSSSILSASADEAQLARTSKCKRPRGPEPGGEEGAAEPIDVEAEEGEPAPQQEDEGAEGSKRARKQLAHFEPEMPNRGRSKKVAAKALDLAPGVNPRTGKPYVRGPYDHKPKGAAGALNDALKGSMAPPIAPIAPIAKEAPDVVAKLKMRIIELEAQLQLAKGELAQERLNVKLLVANATMEAKEKMHEASERMHQALLDKYQDGLRDGANLSSGRPWGSSFAFHTGGASPSCNSASSPGM